MTSSDILTSLDTLSQLARHHSTQPSARRFTKSSKNASTNGQTWLSTKMTSAMIYGSSSVACWLTKTQGRDSILSSPTHSSRQHSSPTKYQAQAHPQDQLGLSSLLQPLFSDADGAIAGGNSAKLAESANMHPENASLSREAEYPRASIKKSSGKSKLENSPKYPYETEPYMFHSSIRAAAKPKLKPKPTISVRSRKKRSHLVSQLI
jgi:hypothetical protein